MRKRYLPSIITAIILVMIVTGFTILELQNNNTTIVIHQYQSEPSEDAVSDTVDDSSLIVLPDVSEEVSEETSLDSSDESSIYESSDLKSEVSEKEKSSENMQESNKEIPNNNKSESSLSVEVSSKPAEQSIQESSVLAEESSHQTSHEEKSNIFSIIPQQSAQEESSKEVVEITPALSAENITLKVGESKKIYLQNTFEGAKWYCDNSAVAGFESADMSGATIEGRMPGTTYVTATVNGTNIELRCIITVLE